jgi:hypothetical protein
LKYKLFSPLSVSVFTRSTPAKYFRKVRLWPGAIIIVAITGQVQVPVLNPVAIIIVAITGQVPVPVLNLVAITGRYIGGTRLAWKILGLSHPTAVKNIE